MIFHCCIHINQIYHFSECWFLKYLQLKILFTLAICHVFLYTETLVHSTLEHCDDADFTFTVFFNLKEYTVYVKQRPYLHAFLERVSEMFEVVIFTASQSIYAKQLLDILDPDGRFISRRMYRESCLFSDGNYTKDLTILGVDLAKVAIIDNSPQVHNRSHSIVSSSISFSSQFLSSFKFLLSVEFSPQMFF